MGLIHLTNEESQAEATTNAQQYFCDAIHYIDAKIEDGFAKKNPDLIAAFMKTAASDMNYTTLAKAQSEAIETLAKAIDNLGYKIESLSPT